MKTFYDVIKIQMIYRRSSVQIYWFYLMINYILALQNWFWTDEALRQAWRGEATIQLSLECKTANDQSCIAGIFTFTFSPHLSSRLHRKWGLHHRDNGFLPLMSVASETFIISSCHPQTSEQSLLINWKISKFINSWPHIFISPNIIL